MIKTILMVTALQMGLAEPIHAQTNLATMYARGEGVKSDLIKAYFWFTLAAEKNDAQAIESLAITEKLITKKQRAEAQALLSNSKK